MGMPRIKKLVLASAALAAGLHGSFGCRQIVGVEDREPPRTCSVTPAGGGSCATCLTSSCCDELEACGDDPACEGEGKLSEVAVDLRVCKATSCGEACALECGGAGLPVVGCQECGRACCAQADACAGSRACGLLEVCQQACGPEDVGCRESCINAQPEGASLAQAIDECVSASCDQGADWSCIGAVEWASPTEQEVSLRLDLVDNATNAPVPGVEVKGCYGSAADCMNPFATGITGPNGYVAFDMPVSPAGNYVAYGGGEYIQHQQFFFPPVTVDQQLPLLAVRSDDFEAINESSGWTLEPGRGVLLISVTDCRGSPAAGVTVSASTADELTEIAYRSDEQAEGGLATDASGQVILFNLPAVSTVLTATVGSLCQDSGSIALQVSDGVLGFADLPPTP